VGAGCRDQAPHDLLHHVALHVAVEQGFLRLLASTCASLAGTSRQRDTAGQREDLPAQDP
jgi:hypothetical protein